MSDKINKEPEWVTKGKTIRQLISELQSFENQDLEVKLSVDAGESYKCISLVGKDEDKGLYFCSLTNHE